MNLRLHHHPATTSRDAREAEIAAAWHLGRLSLFWATAFVVAALVGAPASPPDTLAVEPDAMSAAGMTWGA
jgi:hypothetical protein